MGTGENLLFIQTRGYAPKVKYYNELVHHVENAPCPTLVYRTSFVFGAAEMLSELHGENVRNVQ